MYRILLQDTCTKDVFREMDGFLALFSVLSMIPYGDDQLDREKESARLVFAILDEAMHGNAENAQFFEVRSSAHHLAAY